MSTRNKLEFRPEDFPAAMVTIDDGRPSGPTILNLQHLVCENANARLREMLDACDTAYHCKRSGWRDDEDTPTPCEHCTGYRLVELEK